MNVGVVGAGPAGLIVAAILAGRGETVTVIDEQSDIGGHLTYDSYPIAKSETSSGAWLQELRSGLEASNTTIMRSTVAWAAFRVGSTIELAVNQSGSEHVVTVDQMVVAAGTTDVPLVAPGATLPGVMTSRAVRMLLNRHGVIAAQRFVVIGDGAEAARVRSDLESVGCDVVNVLPTGQIAAITGDTAVQGVRTTDGETIGADAVVLAIGEVPDLQLAGMLEVARAFNPELGGWRLASDDNGTGVHAVGGALQGACTVPALVQSAKTVADRISPSGPGLSDSGFPISSLISQLEPVRI